MRVLLDTHTLIWAAKSPERLSKNAVLILQDSLTVRLVSSASVWEIATKVRLGKLPEASSLESTIVESATRNGYEFLAITPEIALRAGRLVGEHGDPFDRIIAAHALDEDIPVISADAKLDGFGVRRIW
jgi:PIN domain nuclease of toxin-antitoxin system